MRRETGRTYLDERVTRSERNKRTVSSASRSERACEMMGGLTFTPSRRCTTGTGPLPMTGPKRAAGSATETSLPMGALFDPLTTRAIAGISERSRRRATGGRGAVGWKRRAWKRRGVGVRAVVEWSAGRVSAFGWVWSGGCVPPPVRSGVDSNQFASTWEDPTLNRANLEPS